MFFLQGCKKDDKDTDPPGEVTNLTAVPGDEKVTLSWTKPGDVDLKSTEISVYPGSFLPSTLDAEFEIVDVLSLTNGTEYTFSLKTIDDAGNKSDSVLITAIPNEPLVITDPDQNDYSEIFSFSTTADGKLKMVITFNRAVDPITLVPGKTIYAIREATIYDGSVSFSNGFKTVTFISTPLSWRELSARAFSNILQYIFTTIFYISSISITPFPPLKFIALLYFQ